MMEVVLLAEARGFFSMWGGVLHVKITAKLQLFLWGCNDNVTMADPTWGCNGVVTIGNPNYFWCGYYDRLVCRTADTFSF